MFGTLAETWRPVEQIRAASRVVYGKVQGLPPVVLHVSCIPELAGWNGFPILAKETTLHNTDG